MPLVSRVPVLANSVWLRWLGDASCLGQGKADAALVLTVVADLRSRLFSEQPPLTYLEQTLVKHLLAMTRGSRMLCRLAGEGFEVLRKGE